MQKDSSKILHNSLNSVGVQEKRFRSFIIDRLKEIEDKMDTMDKKLFYKIEDVKKQYPKDIKERCDEFD